jgi:hypothetical protein
MLSSKLVAAMFCGGEYSRPRRLRVHRALRSVHRRLREARMFARAMASAHHPILAQIVPIRRCNLACTYCTEFNAFSSPVPLAEMQKRADLLVLLGHKTSSQINDIQGRDPSEYSME